MSARLGRRALLGLTDNLSPRDLAVIDSVAEHRFLSGQQLQRLHFHDHATPATGARVCRNVLARLVRQRSLTRLQRRVGGVRAGSVSYVYHLGPVGRRLASGTAARQVTEPSTNFLAHTLAIGETHLALIEAAQRGAFELLKVKIEPAAWRRYVGVGGAREHVRPDLYVVSARGQFEYCWFLEVDLGSEHKPTVLRKCRAFQSYWQTGQEQQRSGTFPLVVWVTPDPERARDIDKAIRASRSLKQQLFTVVSSERLVELFSGGAS